MVIEINKDIDRYQESVAMGLTAKQLVFSIASVIVGGGIVLLLYRYIGLTGSAYVAIPCVAPIALGGLRRTAWTEGIYCHSVHQKAAAGENWRVES